MAKGVINKEDGKWVAKVDGGPTESFDSYGAAKTWLNQQLRAKEDLPATSRSSHNS